MRAAWIPLLLLASPLPASAAEPRPPNLVLIISDDQGWPHFNFMLEYMKGAYPHLDRSRIPGLPPEGIPLLTPHLDALAHAGAFFPNAAVTAPVCHPSLRAILTGRFPRNDAPGKLDRERHDLFPTRLAAGGYVRMMAGKWWERDPVGYWGFEAQHGEGIGRGSMDPLYDFIRERHLEDPERPPFFIWLAPRMPHVPHAGFPADIHDHYRPGDGKSAYHSMITWLDRRVGELVAHLRRESLLETTVLLFLVDNGHQLPESKGRYSENGTRTPLLVVGPGVRAGVYQQLVSALDLYPTILDYAGLVAPQNLDGRTLRPLVEGRSTAWRSHLFGYQRGLSSVRVRDVEAGTDWKLYMRVGRPISFFDLMADPFERKDLVERDLEPMRELVPVLRAWWEG